MKKLLILLFSLFFLSSTSVFAATTVGGYSCGQLLQYDKNNNITAKNVVINWFNGFTSGMNVAVDKTLVSKIPDHESVYYAIVKYCKDNPLSDTQEASLDIYLTLK